MVFSNTRSPSLLKSCPLITIYLSLSPSKTIAQTHNFFFLPNRRLALAFPTPPEARHDRFSTRDVRCNVRVLKSHTHAHTQAIYNFFTLQSVMPAWTQNKKISPVFSHPSIPLDLFVPVAPLHTPSHPSTPLHTPPQPFTALHTSAHPFKPLHTPSHFFRPKPS